MFVLLTDTCLAINYATPPRAWAANIFAPTTSSAHTERGHPVAVDVYGFGHTLRAHNAVRARGTRPILCC